MAQMKPLPKFILIGVVVGAIAYGAKVGLEAMPKKASEVKPDPVTVTSVPAEGSQPAQQPPAAVAQKPAETPAPAPALQPATSNDAGLANVLGTKK